MKSLSAEQSWWYRYRGDLVIDFLTRFTTKPASGVLQILDAGAGQGGMCERLASFGEVSAYEPFVPAAELCKVKPYTSLSLSLESFKKGERRFDAIVLLDVLEHVADDAGMLKQLNQLCVAGGTLIVTVPAFSFLWSACDDRHGHLRRYQKKKLEELISQAGFSVAYSSYWNFLLFPVVFLLRSMDQFREVAPHYWRDRLFYFVTKLERKAFLYMRFPLGTGIIIVARRQKEAAC